MGEVKKEGKLFLNQIASTVSKLLWYDFTSAPKAENKPVGEVIWGVVK